MLNFNRSPKIIDSWASLIPIMDGLIPFGNNGLLHKEQQFHQRILTLKGTFRFGDGPQLTMK